MVDKKEEEAEYPVQALKLRKRHTRILGTLSKNSSQELIRELVKHKIDGFRLMADSTSEACVRQIKFAR